MKKILISLVLASLLAFPILTGALQEPECSDGQVYVGDYIDGYYTNGDCLEWEYGDCLGYYRVCNTGRIHPILMSSQDVDKCENQWRGDLEENKCCRGVKVGGNWVTGLWEDDGCYEWEDMVCVEYEQVWVDGYWNGECVSEGIDPDPDPDPKSVPFDNIYPSQPSQDFWDWYSNLPKNEQKPVCGDGGLHVSEECELPSWNCSSGQVCNPVSCTCEPKEIPQGILEDLQEQIDRIKEMIEKLMEAIQDYTQGQ